MIGITGHTKGLGKAIFETISGDFIGFSRSNGYDITDPKSREEIVKQSIDCDVFINNAYDQFGQVNLLYDLHMAWKNTDKLIINVSSNSSDGIKKFEHIYAVQKSALDKAAEQLANIPGSCRITNLKPGYIDTKSVEHVKDHPKISIESMVDLVEFLINSSPSFTISSMTVLPR